VLLLLTACATTTAGSLRTNASTATPGGILPAFSDWRVAYLGQDGTVHAVAVDGKQEADGVQLSGLDQPGLNLGEAQASPDGRMLAYPDASGMTVIALSGTATTGEALRHIPGLTYDLAWSSDGSMLALSDRGTSIRVLRVQGFQFTQIPLPTSVARVDLLGWIDTGHLAVTTSFTGAMGLQLDALDIVTGKLRLIRSLPSAGLGTLTWSLSPDGKQALLANGPFRDDPYTPFVEILNTATGQVHQLPNALKVTSSAWSGVAWKPGTATVAVATWAGAPSNAGDVMALWLVDTQHDTAVQIPHADQLAPGGVFPLGWAPDGGPLIVGSSNIARICCSSGDTPEKLRALTVAADGSATSVKLTDTAITFPWLGLVKTK
jgi:hypothetical protein